MAAPQLLQVNFVDSSDDDNSHVAGVGVVPDGNGRSDAQAREPIATGRGDRLWNSVSDAVSGASARFFGIYGSVSHEPFPVEQQPESSDSSHLYRMYHGIDGSSLSGDGTSSRSTRTDHFLGNDVDNQTVQIDLREAILQYQRTPSPLGLNMVLATLKSGASRIDGDVFSAAAGNPFLIRTCLDSGAVDLDDAMVQRIIQEEIEKVLTGDPYKGHFVDASQADYLRVLCNVPSSRISQRQMVLMRYSGFEFIEMLFVCPHLMSDLEQPSRLSQLPFRILYIVNNITCWLTIAMSLLFTASTVWLAVYWFVNDAKRNYGYWTIICYVGGYVVDLVSTMWMEQDKIKVYDDQIWVYPDNSLKVIPIIPVYEIALTYTALRYELQGDRYSYYVIRYDLRRGIGAQQVLYGICFAIPQIILQSFLFIDRNTDTWNRNITAVCFWLLLISGVVSFAMSVLAYIQLVLFPHSCNAVGFAFMTVDSAEHRKYMRHQRVMPTDVVTRVLSFFTMYFLVASAITLLIFLLNLSGCNGPAKAFLSVYIVVVVLTWAGLVGIMMHSALPRLTGLMCIGVLIMQIAYFLFTHKNRVPREGGECSFFMYSTSTWLITLFTMFGCVCVLFLLWVALVLYEVISGKRIQQTLLDTHLDF